MNAIMKKYLLGLKPFFAFRSPEFVGAKIIHRSAKKPNYLIYMGCVDVPGGTIMINVSNPRTKREASFDAVEGWFFWEPFTSNVSDTKKGSESSRDTDLVNTLIEAINIKMLEDGVKDPRTISVELGDIFLDVLLGSHRKAEIFDRSHD